MSTVPSTSPPTSPPAPSWLAQLLDAKTLPTLPLPGASHNKPRHPDLTPLISDGHFHPALEAALHLANGDLYSAHFLVRKAQGGARELDWGHALLHRLEGDMGNAKCWYTDLSTLGKSKLFLDFVGTLPRGVSSYKDLGTGAIASAVSETTRKFKKIPREASFTADELRDFEAGQVDLPLTREQTEKLAGEETRIMVLGCADEFGWGEYDVKESVEAFQSQSGVGDEQKVQHNAEAMVAGGGSRTF